MGMLTDVFVATRDEADALDLRWGPAGPPPAGPGPHEPLFPTVQAKWLDPVLLSRLETSLTGTTFEQMLPNLSGGYQRMDNLEDGPWLTGVRPSLAAALALLSEDDVAHVTSSWMTAEEMAEWSAADAGWVVTELRRLAGVGQSTGREMFVWMCL